MVTGLTLLIPFGTDVCKNCVTVSFRKIDAVKAILNLRDINPYFPHLLSIRVTFGIKRTAHNTADI